MREECGVEVKTVAALRRPVRPGGEVLRLYPVSVNRMVCVNVYCVNICLLFAGNVGKRLVHVAPYLVRGSRPSGVVAGCLDSARERAAGVLKAYNVIALPAVQRYGYFVRLFYRSVSVNADFRIFFLCNFVCLFSNFFSHFSAAFHIFIACIAEHFSTVFSEKPYCV